VRASESSAQGTSLVSPGEVDLSGRCVRDLSQHGSSDSDDPMASSTDLGDDDEETLLCFPEKEQGAEAGSVHAVWAAASSGGAAGAPAGKKRKTKERPKPPQSKKKKKRSTPFGETFAQAEDNDLLGVVINRSDPYQSLSRGQIAQVRNDLFKLLDEASDTEPVVP